MEDVVKVTTKDYIFLVYKMYAMHTSKKKNILSDSGKISKIGYGRRILKHFPLNGSPDLPGIELFDPYQESFF
jgi:hypothetical protein